MASTLNAVTTGPGGILFTGDTTGAMALQTLNGNTAVYVDTSQNVGFGTTSPQSKLMSQPTGTFTAAGTISNAGLHLTSSTTTGGLAGQSIVWSNYGTSGSAVQAYISACTYGSNFMAFSSSGSSEAMRIDSSSNLLVGTTSALSQTGRATFVGTGNGLVTQVGNSTTAYQSTNTSGTSAYYAAIWSNNGNTFSTCGTIQVSGTTTSYNTSSDYRLKEDVQPMTGALAKVAQLKPVTYKWKSDGTEGEGFIAHELAEVCPHAVSGEKDALKEDGSIMPQGIDTSFLVATLTAAIQELKAINETQSETITALIARIEALEKK